MKDETIVLRNQVRALAQLTNTRIDEVDDEKNQFHRELQVIAQSADALEEEESQYKNQINSKLTKIHEFLKQVHAVLSSTYREPELERILRDLEKVSADVGLEKDGKALALKRAGVTNEDVIARQMRKANEEINHVERLEEER